MAHRANGEGTISRRKTGTWIGQITIGIDRATGKQIRKTCSGKTQAECKQNLDKLKQQYMGVRLTKRDNRSGKMLYIDYLLNDWINEKRNIERLEESTIQTHLQRIHSYFTEFFKNVTLEQINVEMLTRFYASLWRLAPVTIHKIHAIVNNSLKKAERDNLIPKNPAQHIKLPKIHVKEKKSLTDEEVRKLLQTAKEMSDKNQFNKNLYIFVLLGVTTGLRRGELLALTWDDVDFERCKISVNKSVSDVGSICTVKGTKTDASIRTIAVDKTVLEILKHHRETWATGSLVFPSRYDKNKVQRPHNVGLTWKKLITRAGIKCNIHMLRHTNITNMIVAGTNLKTVQQRAGHSCLSTTLSYTHPSEEYDREAAEIFGKFL